MRKFLLPFIAVIALVSAGSTLADTNTGTSLKIGVIDVQKILQESPQIKVINNKLISDFKPRQDKIVELKKSLQAEADQLGKNGSTMNDADRNKLQDKIIADKANLQGLAVSFQRDLQQAQNSAMQSFMSQLTANVATVAKKNGYDLVLQRAGVPYAGANLDITAAVLQAGK